MSQTESSREHIQNSWDTIIVGAGMGGLMAGALLAAGGQKVLLLEASNRIGGFQHRFEHKKFHIEANFHFLQEAGPGRPIRELLALAGVEPEWLPLDPVVEFNFPDRVVKVPTDRSLYISDLIAMFPQECDGITALFDSMGALYKVMLDWPLAKLQGLAPEQLPPECAALMAHANDSMDDYSARFVASRELKVILAGWATYFGYCGSRIAALPIIAFTESCWDGGNFHPVGGIDTIAQALKTRIEHGGGGVCLSTPVRRIRIEGQRAVGVELSSGELVNASSVVSNANIFTTYNDLIGAAQSPPGVIDQLNQMEQFRSPLTVYIGVRARGLNLESRAAVHVVVPGYNTEVGDNAQVDGRLDNVAVSIGIPTLVTPELAPPGHHLLKIYTFVGASLIDRLRNDEALKQICTRQLIAAAERGIPGLSEHMVMSVLSVDAYPDLYDKYTSGAIGWAANITTLMAAPDQTTAIKGFYLVGQWTNFFTAMNNVFRSSQRAATAILDKL